MRVENGKRIYSVRDVNAYTENIITQDYMLKNICLEGEITQYNKAGTGHIYLTLKDCTPPGQAGYDASYNGILKVNIWKSTAQRLQVELSVGDVIVLTGRAGIYAPNGTYSISASTVRKKEETGWHGAAYAETKKRLEAEGLFDAAIKKPIPKYPKTVGILASVGTNGYKDITVNGKKQNPYIQMYVCDSRVQGENAVEMLVDGIRRLDRMGLSVIVIVRGGGAKEDLNAFDDERVVRAVYQAKTPVISGTGHEGDFSLTDEAADARESTPSMVAKRVFPDASDIRSNLNYRAREMAQYMGGKCHLQQNELETVKKEMTIHMQSKLQTMKDQIASYARLIQTGSPQAKLAENREVLQRKSELLKGNTNSLLQRYNHRIEMLLATLHGNSPTAKLTGGFGYLEVQGHPVLSAADTKAGDTLRVVVHDGEISATVDDVKITEEI